MSSTLVAAVGLVKRFDRRGGWRGATTQVQAVNGVDLRVDDQEIVGLVGESGSGKSTLGRMTIRLIEPDAGELRFDGEDLLGLAPRELRRRRRDFQMVFQDPYGSLNPRMRVGTAVGEALVVHGLVDSRAELLSRVAHLFELVGLDPALVSRFPHEFSGGQRQRIGIARAIACEPRFLVADEPVSALDPPVQAQIVNLLVGLQERLGMAYLLIAHDLHLVRRVADRVAVMYLGRIVEEGPAAELYDHPLHPYTQLLLASTPRAEPGRRAADLPVHEIPSDSQLPPGCPFHPRCPVVEPRCKAVRPALIDAAPGHRVACLRVAGS